MHVYIYIFQILYKKGGYSWHSQIHTFVLYNAGIETNCFVIQYSLNDSKDMVSEVMKNILRRQMLTIARRNA